MGGDTVPVAVQCPIHWKLGVDGDVDTRSYTPTRRSRDEVELAFIERQQLPLFGRRASLHGPHSI